ncbi:uncharacterized protein LOC123484217 [Coregonus clupeaformis]|uniref:uncharacterized protein LOC123484217 n=1 Tax=Coregonus clupeaformis TaxID=59861 RepID=UPI001E1C25E8|nr:uncharacterized protein LOC123484217 [Coregonus clupeaformis]
MASPVIRVINPDAPPYRQQAVLVATKEARYYREKRMLFPKPPQELRNQATALAHAEKLPSSGGYPHSFASAVPGKAGDTIWPYIDKHRSEETTQHREGERVNQGVKDYLNEYAESFPQVCILLEANIDRCIYGQRGFEESTFQEMWTLYSKYPTQKDRPELFSEEEKEIIKKAYSSVRRWLHTPVTHITSVQMKRFRKYIVDKEQQPQASTSKCDPSSWPGDDSELLAASQAVEDTIKQFEPPVRPKQPEPLSGPRSPSPCPAQEA